MITQRELKAAVKYNPETGVFTNHRGKVMGRANEQGYILIGVDGKCYRAHRLAWLYVYGKLPKGNLDHKNRIRADNWIDNLRESSQAENTKNRSMQSNNTTGYTGVYPNPYKRKDGVQRYYIEINHKGKTRTIGKFNSMKEASDYRVELLCELGFDKEHGLFPSQYTPTHLCGGGATKD